MDKFAFMVHPLDEYYVANFFTKGLSKIPFINRYKDSIRELVIKNHNNPCIERNLTQRIIEAYSQRWPLPFDKADISSDGKVVHGELIAVPFTSKQMINSKNKEIVFEYILKAVKLAERRGIKVLGLGAYTSVVTDGGKLLVDETDLTVSNGNNYTIASALEVALVAADRMRINLEDAKAAIVGVGSIGKICAEMITKYVHDITLVGREESGREKLEKAKEQILEVSKREGYGEPEIDVATNISVLKDKDIVISATNNPKTVIRCVDNLKRGSVIIDVARPHDVKKEIADPKNGILVIDGGIVKVPGNVYLKSLELDPGLGFACFSEAALLSLEGIIGDYTRTDIERVKQMKGLAKKYDFKVQTKNFRSFRRVLTDDAVEEIYRNSQIN